MKKPFILLFIASAMLFGALLDGLPYGYFQVLRWVVCICAGLLAFGLFEEEQKTPAFIFGGIAILFNPILIFRFPRETWTIIDAIVGIIFLVYIFRKHRQGR